MGLLFIDKFGISLQKIDNPMARPIRDTPVLKGKDARRFLEAMDNLKPATPEEKKRAKEAYEFFKSIATFPLP
jgi:hypothetical protein